MYTLPPPFAPISVNLLRKFPSESPSMYLSIVSKRIEAKQGHLLFATNTVSQTPKYQLSLCVKPKFSANLKK